MTISGQLWYTILDIPGSSPRSVGGYLNSDGTSITPSGPVLNPAPSNPSTFPFVPTAFNIAVDTAAGYAFVANTDGLTVSVYNINTNTLVQTLQVGDPNGAGSFDDDVVNAVAVDPINHTLFVNRWDSDTTHTGIVKISYDPATGLLNSNGAFNSGNQQFLLTNASTGNNYTTATNFEIDIATHKLYYTDWDNGYSTAPFTSTNAIYVVSDYTAVNPTVTKLTLDAQFPNTVGANFLGNIAVDDAKGLIYFTTLDYGDPGQGHLWYMPITGGTAVKIMDIDNLNLGGVPSGLSLDPATQQLYVSLAYYDPPAAGAYPNAPTANANKIVVFQLSADGHSLGSPIATYTLNQLEGQAPADVGSHPGGSVWNALPVLSVAGTSTHAGEQGAAITPSTSFTSSDTDGGFYSGATVQITGGTFASNETSANDDHLFVQDGGTQRTSGTFTGTSITVSYDSATEKLILSGYDTIAHYNTVMAALRYNTTGDNPTNYGNNTTRAITWTVSDGSLNVTAGQGQNSGTTTLTIDAVNDYPVNHLPGGLSINEDLLTTISGVTVTDADADPANQDITVTLSVANGTLSIRTDVAGGILLGDITGGGNGTNSITITATQNQINATLGNATGLRYLSNLNFNGSDTLHVVTNDNGHTGTGGALTDTDDVTVTITAVNDPVTSAAPTTLTLAEDAGLTPISGLSIADVDTALAPGGQYSVTLSSIHGTLTLATIIGLSFSAGSNGSATMTFTGTLADINTALASAGYAPVANYNGADTINISVTDIVGAVVATGSGGPTSDSDTINVTVTAVNDPVATNAPPTLILAEDAGATPIGGLSIADVDAALAPAGTYEATLTSTNGTLTLGVLAGLTFTAGDGATDATMTFHGTLAAINAALATASYTPAANYNGPATIAFSATDQFGGVVATGTGLATSDSDAINVTVTAVNDAPAVDLNGVGGGTGVTLNYTENGAATAIAPAGTLVDVDSADLNGGSLTARFTVGGPEDQLSILTGGGITLNGANVEFGGQVIGTVIGGANGTDLIVTFNSSFATPAAVQALVEHIGYADNSDNPSTLQRIVTFTVDDGDGGASAGVATATINVTAQNDAPVATITPPSYQGQPNVLINLKNSGLLVSDIDSGGGSETVTLSVTSGTLTATAGNSGAGVSGTGTNALTITGTIGEINAFLNTSTSTLSFVDSSGGPKTLTLLINDNGNTGVGGSLTAQDTAQILLGDAPVIVGTGPSITYGEQQAGVVIDNDLLITDNDAPAFPAAQVNSATVSISAGFVAGDFLNFTNTATITGSYNIGTGLLTLTGPATLAEYEAALRSITFSSTSDNPTNFALNNSRTITWAVKDTLNIESSPVTSTINVTAVNDGPHAAIAAPSYAATEPVLLDLKTGGLSVSDIDGGGGGQVETVTLTVDVGTLNVTAGGSGAIVSNSGTNIVTITGSIAQINALLGSDPASTVTYVNPSDTPPASATLTLTIDDGGATGGAGGLTDSVSRTINITAVNDAPVQTGSHGATVVEGGNYTITALELGYTDPDNGPADITFLVSGALNGSVQVGGVDVASFTAGQLAGGLVSFHHDGSETANASFQVAVEDLNQDGSPPVPVPFNLNVTPVNDDPVLTVAASASYTENGGGVLLDPALTVTDVDGGILYTATVTIGGAVAGDVLSGGGGAYDAGTHTLALAAGSATLLEFLLRAVSFSSASDDPTAAPRTLTWTINDGAGGTSTKTSTVNVTPVNDPPVLTGGLSATMAEGGDHIIGAAELGYIDPDDVDSGVTFSVSGAVNGAVRIGGVSVTSFTGQQLAAGLVSFHHDGSETANASFLVSVEDGNEDGSAPPAPVPFLLTVTAVNDPATVALSNLHAPIFENASTAVHIKMADITVSDVDAGINVLSLSGVDAALFEIVGNELFLKAGAHLDFETNPVLNVSVDVDDATIPGSPDGGTAFALNILDIAENKTGTPGNDTLVGTNNGETLSGLGGNDRIIALGGNDRIIGGLGVDVMTGGAGNDVFVFNSIYDSAPGQSGLVNASSYGAAAGQGKRDVITDFTHGQDKIDLSAMDSNINVAGNQAFAWRGTGNFTHSPGQLIERLYNPAGTAFDKTIIYGDINGDARADFQIELTGLKTITVSDFIL